MQHYSTSQINLECRARFGDVKWISGGGSQPDGFLWRRGVTLDGAGEEEGMARGMSGQSGKQAVRGRNWRGVTGMGSAGEAKVYY